MKKLIAVIIAAFAIAGCEKTVYVDSATGAEVPAETVVGMMKHNSWKELGFERVCVDGWQYAVHEDYNIFDGRANMYVIWGSEGRWPQACGKNSLANGEYK